MSQWTVVGPCWVLHFENQVLTDVEADHILPRDNRLEVAKETTGEEGTRQRLTVVEGWLEKSGLRQPQPS